MAAKPTGYSLLNYGDMITCEPRMSRYVAALKQAITPGCTVIDLGSGPGVFAVLACRFGAGSAIAIEPDETSQLVMQLAHANGCTDRVSVFEGISDDYRTGSRADIIISDLHGSLPLYERHIPTIVDARQRLLKPGGTLIPVRDTLWLALVHNAKVRSSYETPWHSNSLDLDLQAGLRLVSNQPVKTALEAGDLLSEAVTLGTIDYRLVEEADFSATAEIRNARAGEAHGFVIWFDCEPADGIGFSNAPGQPTQVYGQTFFPFLKPIDLKEGDEVRIEITAKLAGGEYIWNWVSSLRGVDSSSVDEPQRQSTFHAKVFSSRSLGAHSSEFIPNNSQTLDVDRTCLQMVDGRRSLGAIADDLFARFPSRFGSATDALDYVTRLTAGYR